MPGRNHLALSLALLAALPADAQSLSRSASGGGGIPLHPHGENVATTRRLELPEGATSAAVPELGIEVVAVRLSAAGGLVDLRYRIVDLDRASLALRSAPAAQLLDPRTGAEGAVPVDEKLGALSQNGNRLRPGQVLAVLFRNPNRGLKKGDLVTIRLGGWEIAGLTIQG